ncbi:SLC13 family permease [Buttiauxella sp. WJP83]|uniref:SLC13 family permease n=1 Tax=Buttiauxella sp. WJP83 TaxID=2986951 RepID=UPI0022DE6E17|nr:SLC13 family permease [Buttiauxella sp. WJP83]WBM69460.1 SLC13 family permease [Buttiauxella sp. WJP83]
MLLTLIRPFARDRFLHLLLLIGVVLSFIAPFHPTLWANAIDWHTIITLAGLMMLTKGVELSGYFDVLGRRMVKRFDNERTLALFLISAAALLSTFLTNDVALFIIVPLTITLKKMCAIPINRLIIFEALAVNAGSMLTPIGNPQNILLWGRTGLSFGEFSWQMAPLALAIMLSLLALSWFCFPNKKLIYQSHDKKHDWQPKLVLSCVALYGVFIVALELKQEIWGLVVVAAGFLVLARRVLLNIDWSLLLVFMVMFIDVYLITQLPVLQHALAGINQLSTGGIFALGIGLSQVISNVPSTILLLNYVPASMLLAFAVNIGGFGLLPGSLANLIALRMANDRRIWVRFHYYSLPMLLWAAAVGYGLLLWLKAL